MISQQTHIYKHVQSQIVIFHQHVSLTSVSIIRWSYAKNTINVVIIVQKYDKTTWCYIWFIYRVPYGHKILNYKRKAIPLQAWTGPEGSRRLRLPDFKTIGTWKWEGCQPYVPAALTPSPPPGSIPGTHFCQRLSRTQSPIVRTGGGLCQWKTPMTPLWKKLNFMIVKFKKIKTGCVYVF